MKTKEPYHIKARAILEGSEWFWEVANHNGWDGWNHIAAGTSATRSDAIEDAARALDKWYKSNWTGEDITMDVITRAEEL